ncbi:hypothetical protein Dsin_015447 [Dipteronia sinensis]|uniref:Uncharacterized protein n=1 Tax=Dipteronia sinensis TaxID=43782 RepID=A0AAE0E4K4_9ROSI|nr:hypothetical protein Dsin_015447 [Dipteronia sinensis]
MLTRHTRLFQLALNVIENVVGSEEASKILEDDLNNVLSKIKSGVTNKSISERHTIMLRNYNDPLAVRAKGSSMTNDDEHPNLCAMDDDSLSSAGFVFAVRLCVAFELECERVVLF